jgi:membrane-bound lytic murein transglycosylase D
MTISPLIVRPTADPIPEGKLPEEEEPALPLVSREDLRAVEELEAKGESPLGQGPAAETAPEAPTFDVPIVMNEKVKAFLAYFQTGKRGVVTRAIERARRYLPMMREIFQAKDVPLDLLNLAFIESAFNPFATSRARATGIWQFMEPTARLYGLRSDWWHDERRDPAKATAGAAAYLKALFGMFNSWPLAIAAYNAGEGKVQRAVERQRTTDFWALKLPRETQAFVPAFMAMTIIAKDPERHGFPPLDPDPLRTDQVTIRGPADLRVIARSAGTSLEEIRLLNPEVTRLVTPPTRPTYDLRLPYGSKQAFLETFAAVPKSQRVSWQRHPVRKGETFATIARRFRVPTGLLLEINGTAKAHPLKPGTMVAVPLPALGKPGTADGVPLVARKEPRKRQAPVGQARATPVAPRPTHYTLKAGDTLWRVARAHGITVEALARANNLTPHQRLQPGVSLLIPAPGP